jgi:hypothetical protein
MIRDTSDELTESSLKKLMGKQLTEEFYDYAKANPEIFKDLKWFQRVWAKEGAVNGGLLLLNLAYEVLLGTPMSEQEKMEAKGVITTVPEELRIHFLTQILKNSENTQKLRNNGAEIAQKMSQSLSEMGVDVSAARKIAEIELKELAVQDSLDQYGIDYSTKFIETDNKIPEGYIKLTDEELETNLQYVVDIKSINGVNYYLLDKTNLSQ